MSDDDVINASHSASAGYLSCASFLHGRAVWRLSLQTAVFFGNASFTNGDNVSYGAPRLGAKLASRARYLNVAFLFVDISISVNVRFTNTSNVPPKSTSWPQNHHKDFFKKKQ